MSMTSLLQARTRRRVRATLVSGAFAAMAANVAVAQAPSPPRDTLHVFGPGGPLPAMKEAGAAFAARHGVHVAVTGGPTPQWVARAKRDADVIFSGAEHMMTDFVRQLRDTVREIPGRIDESTIRPLYLRPVAILVRPGNPRRITRFEDLLRPNTRVLVVQGAGQTGLWEDVAGRTGDIEVIRSFRRNIAAVAPNSGDARERWQRDSTIDAWLIWSIWQVANPALADAVPVAEPWLIYRDMGVALTVKGRSSAHARSFAAFLESPEGARIFERWGWLTRKPQTR